MKVLLFAAASIVIVVAALFLIREPLLLAVGDFLVVQDQLYPADVIHVIAGPDYRTDYAIQLYEQGLAKQLFFTGGWCSIHKVFHGQHGRALAEREGIPRKAIASDDTPVTSTYAEVVRLKAFLEQSKAPLRSVIVVSDPFHMRRALWTYHKIFGDEVEIQMAPIPFDQTPYKQQWWTDALSQRYVKDEYKKIAYYWLRYQLSLEWLAIFDKE